MPCVNHPEVLDPLMRCTRCAQEFCSNCLVELKGGRFCAGCKKEQVKDLQSGVDAAEFPLAGIPYRIAAMMLDSVILSALVMPLAIVLGIFTIPAPGQPPSPLGGQLIFQFGFMGVLLLYEGILLQWRGQTFGKMALKIKVVTPEGTDISGVQAWVRALVRVILSCGFLTYLPAFFTKQKTALHDLAARTRVVRLNP